MDYYDYTPTVFLERPVALTGFLGGKLGHVGSMIAQRTGLSLIDLPRWVEHEAGRSLSELVLLDGEGALRAIEARLLRRALDDRPAGIIALGDGTLLDPDNRRLVQEKARLVYLKADLDDALRCIRAHLRESPGELPDFVLNEPESVQALRPLFEARREGYEGAEVVLEVSGKHPNRIAEEIIAILED